MPPEKILGIKFIGHDSSFSIIQNGVITSVLELERINGDRFAAGWPLAGGGIWEAKEIDRRINYYIKETDFFWEEHAKDIGYVAVPGLYTFKKKYATLHELYIKRFILAVNKKFKSKIPTNLFRIKHHESHASLSCFTSPFGGSYVVSVDGIGNDGYFRIFHHENNKLSKFANYNIKMGKAYHHNAFLIDDNFGYFLAAPGKLMGLSAYGKRTSKYYKIAKKFILSYPKYKIKDKKFKGVKNKKTQDWMKSFQDAWTDILIKNIQKKVPPQSNICLAGGCALNGIANYQIYNRITKNIYIPPNPSDCGVTAGAALNLYYCVQKNEYKPIKWQNPFLGIPIMDQSNLQAYMTRKDYTGKISIPELCDIINKKKIIGVIQGNSEIGPRALGNRSIICDCSDPRMRDILNEKVKHREWYRPFAPIVRKEDVDKYFDFDRDSYYMSYVVPVKKAYQSIIPSACHVDGTARLQTVTRESSGFLYELLSIYNNKFGVGVLLNTSFNIKGKSILSHLKDAFNVLDNTRLDGLYVDGCFWLK